MSDPNGSTSTGDDVPVSSQFLEFCAKVRKNDPSILPEPGQPFNIHHWQMDEKEDIELADALLRNTNVTYLELETETYTNRSAEAMAKYVRTSKRLQRIRWHDESAEDQELEQYKGMFCCFLPAFQDSTSLKELHINFPVTDGGPSNLALENMLTSTQSLRSLSLSCPAEGDVDVSAAWSGLKKNTTLRELNLDFSRRATSISSLFTSLRDHPLFRRLCLHGYAVDLTGLETLLLSETSKITELEIHRAYGGPPMMGFTHILQALAHRPTLTKLVLRCCPLRCDEARLLCMALRSIPSLHSLFLNDGTLGSAGLTELAPALYHNTSIKVLDMSSNRLGGMESAEILRGILGSNKTITTLGLSDNTFGQTTGAVACIADGLGRNSMLLKIDLSGCALGDVGVSILAQALGSRNTTLQKLILSSNSITSTGVGVLLETMEHNSHHITELDLRRNPTIGNEGASLLARYLGNNALPNLTRLSLSYCGFWDDGFIALISALAQNTSLLHLDLCFAHGVSERAFLALAESLPDIKVLRRVEFNWCPGLGSAMPSLLVGLRKNTSLFRIHVANCPPISARFAGSWMQEIKCLGYRNRFLWYRNRLIPLIRAPKERLPPLGVWSHALARVAAHPDLIFEVLRSKPNLVPSEHTAGKYAATDTGIPKKRKRGDE